MEKRPALLTLPPTKSKSSLPRKPGPLGDPDHYLTKPELIVKGYLNLALRDFTGSMIGSRLIYRFATETPDLFCNAGLALLIGADHTPAFRYLTHLLLRQDDVMGIVADPIRFNKLDAQTLFLHLMSFDPGLDIRLAKYVQRNENNLQGRFTDQTAERALDILDVASHGRRIVQILSHLVEHNNPRISSKATLVIGRRIQNVDWVERQMKIQDDPRHRANAIQSIWGIDSQKARRLLEDHVPDPNNRVAGNATYGLHTLGDTRASEFAKRMANHADPEFRWTAAWVMGKIGHPNLVDPLQELLRDDNPQVKSASLRALVGIQREFARQEAAKPRIVLPVPLQPAKVAAEKRVQEKRAQNKGRILIPDMEISLDGKHTATRLVYR